MEIIIVFVCICIGNAISVLLPYYNKKLKNKDLFFDFKYLKSTFISIMGSAVMMVPVFLAMSPNGLVEDLSTYIFAIGFGFGGEAFVTKLQDIIHTKKMVNRSDQR